MNFLVRAAASLAALLMFSLPVFSLPAPARGGENPGLIESIREAQKGLRTVRAAFKQEKRTELLDRPVRSEGKFYFKSPAGVRWEYDKTMVVIYDGESLYIYYSELDEAEKINGAGGFVGPLGFDLGLLRKEFDIKASGKQGRSILSLRPKKDMPFELMEMVFAGGAAFPEEVRIIEENGDRTVITFFNVETNVDVPDSMFVFAPPPGVRLRERNLQ